MKTLFLVILEICSSTSEKINGNTDHKVDLLNLEDKKTKKKVTWNEEGNRTVEIEARKKPLYDKFIDYLETRLK